MSAPEALACPIDARNPWAIENRGGPCTGGLCLCGADGVHVRLDDGSVSCGWCRACLQRCGSLRAPHAPLPGMVPARAAVVDVREAPALPAVACVVCLRTIEAGAPRLFGLGHDDWPMHEGCSRRPRRLLEAARAVAEKRGEDCARCGARAGTACDPVKHDARLTPAALAADYADVRTSVILRGAAMMLEECADLFVVCGAADGARSARRMSTEMRGRAVLLEGIADGTRPCTASPPSSWAEVLRAVREVQS